MYSFAIITCCDQRSSLHQTTLWCDCGPCYILLQRAAFILTGSPCITVTPLTQSMMYEDSSTVCLQLASWLQEMRLGCSATLLLLVVVLETLRMDSETPGEQTHAFNQVQKYSHPRWSTNNLCREYVEGQSKTETHANGDTKRNVYMNSKYIYIVF